MIDDPHSEVRLAKLYPDIATRWREVRDRMMSQYQRQISVSDGLRAFQVQSDLWKRGRQLVNGEWKVTEPTKVITYAPPGRSYHNYGLAVDSIFKGNDPYLEKCSLGESIRAWNNFGKIARAVGFVWGGDWSSAKTDRTHLEMSYGFKVDDIQMMYSEQSLPFIWSKIDQVRRQRGMKTS
jgi:peptidoglycan L-alanyl-D-glutamate endopeptidase CwlK